MLTGISKDILDAYRRGEPTPGITKGLLSRLIRVHEARAREERVDHREQDIMRDIERHIIKKLRM